MLPPLELPRGPNTFITLAAHSSPLESSSPVRGCLMLGLRLTAPTRSYQTRAPDLRYPASTCPKHSPEGKGPSPSLSFPGAPLERRHRITRRRATCTPGSAEQKPRAVESREGGSSLFVNFSARFHRNKEHPKSGGTFLKEVFVRNPYAVKHS